MDIPLLCVSDGFEAHDYDEGDVKTPRGQAAPHAPEVGREGGGSRSTLWALATSQVSVKEGYDSNT